MTLKNPPIIKQPENKAALRTTALAYRAALPAEKRRHYSDQIANRLCAYLARLCVPVSSLLLYRSMPSEVNTDRLFELPDYRIFAPVTHHHQQMEWRLTTNRTTWAAGLFGVQEPASGSLWSDEPATVLLCPLAAFDRQGNRLGMGKGCFDYWLGSHRHALIQVIGLAFAGQEVAHIPAEAHDAPLDCIITEKEVIECPKA